mmetsp:Transcript_49424/g.125554  ORF Transcript_49424/g.125554 Transcript_49424/m.125554 type:complete len:213 (+) Transcript_49424:535-1173(+)
MLIGEPDSGPRARPAAMQAQETSKPGSTPPRAIATSDSFDGTSPSRRDTAPRVPTEARGQAGNKNGGERFTLYLAAAARRPVSIAVTVAMIAPVQGRSCCKATVTMLITSSEFGSFIAAALVSAGTTAKLVALHAKSVRRDRSTKAPHCQPSTSLLGRSLSNNMTSNDFPSSFMGVRNTSGFPNLAMLSARPWMFASAFAGSWPAATAPFQM